ncbi:lipopolysaccharide heptosyltransferase II [bacterium]|nr:lipopolysaccharide heptosyltransferase II [bacterium]
MMDYKRILLIRTDRIGDVLLTTPAIEAVREKFPLAHIAVMVRPYAKEVVDGNPYIDEIIIYDKYGKHKSIMASYYFAKVLKKKNFDVAMIFHPTNRTHIITYLAAIPQRIGYDRNLPFLLTDKIPHTKQFGKMHEIDYALGMLKPLNITDVKRKKLYMPIKGQSENSVNSLFAAESIDANEKKVIFHPGASCASKIWPADRFATVADRLIRNFNVKVIIVGGEDEKDITSAEAMKDYMSDKAVSFAGKLSISELASCLKRAAVFISNDSGPVHIASAVGTPAVVIFGRSLPGLSPRRWGPTGRNDVVLHKDVGCGDTCLAHNCKKDFACLKAITVDEVYEAAERFLN